MSEEFGLWTRTGAGVRRITPVARLPRVQGMVDSGTTSGSLVNPAFAEGEPFAFPTPKSGSLSGGNYGIV